VSWFLTKSFEPYRGYRCRLQHARILCRGQFTIKSLSNFQTQGVQKTVDVTGEGGQWDVDGWDDPDVGWSEEQIEGYADFWPRNTANAFQLRIDETSSLTHTSLEKFGAEPIVGAWSLYGLNLSFSPLQPAVQ